MSGSEVLMRFKNDLELQKIPVIIMTAVVPQDQGYRLHDARAAGYLLKPFDVNELLLKVKQTIGN